MGAESKSLVLSKDKDFFFMYSREIAVCYVD